MSRAVVFKPLRELQTQTQVELSRPPRRAMVATMPSPPRSAP
ncbi:hypothetical protein GLE_3074 [Lysobacter enzymogenes]|uniref:Uncharacterized protein n=1 Tax=Lysobacter enzymogenes TaxID=69 RepID=A0A0S2DIH5_LYSEN|nr:hypothetical protein GLE_3074 [Lysobacter enzymogenes]